MAERGGYYWDVGAYRNSDKVRLMDFETRGVYREVLDEIWVTGSVPDDAPTIAALLRIPPDVLVRTWPTIHDCLIPLKKDPSRFTSERIEIERRRRDKIRKIRKTLGQRGGKTTQAKKREASQLAAVTGDNNKAIASDLLKQTSSQAKAILDTSTSTSTSNKKEEKPSLRSGKKKCPDVLPVTDDHREWAMKNHISIDLEAETAAMMDWARSNGSLKLDWEATRRNWWRNAQKRLGVNGNGGRSKAEQRRDENDRAVRDFLSHRTAGAGGSNQNG